MSKKRSPGLTRVVYIGPTIRGVVRQYTTFIDGLPEHLKKKAGEIPAIRGLIIPLETLPKAMAELRGREGYYYALYRKVQSKL